jgi:hypothetical protein
VREPERPRMAVISELLQISHHTCARGSKVERAFLREVAVALELPGAAQMTKYQVLDALHQTLHGGSPMPSEYKSTGSTITDEALQTIINGLVRTGRARVSLTEGASAARIAVATASAQPTAEDPPAPDDPFAHLVLSDERREALRSLKLRAGQGAFRDALLRAYEGRCAISSCNVPEALEAVYIRPGKGPKNSTVPHGLLLRADLHRLWDTGRLAVHESTHEVLLDRGMIGTDYSFLVGSRINVPTEAKHCPSSAALELQRKWCGL